MSEAKFTPGPLYPADISYTRNGERMFHLVDDNGNVVCDGYMTEANATLWASAPELYAAARLLVALEDADAAAADTRWKEARYALRAALSKAEGGAK